MSTDTLATPTQTPVVQDVASLSSQLSHCALVTPPPLLDPVSPPLLEDRITPSDAWLGLHGAPMDYSEQRVQLPLIVNKCPWPRSQMLLNVPEATPVGAAGDNMGATHHHNDSSRGGSIVVGGPILSPAATRWDAIRAMSSDIVPYQRISRATPKPRAVHAELLAKLQQKATGKPRTTELVPTLWIYGVAWCKEHGVASEVVINDMVGPCVAACMGVTPGDMCIAAILDTYGGRRNLAEANRIAAGQFGESWWSRFIRCFTPPIYSNAISGAYSLPSR